MIEWLKSKLNSKADFSEDEEFEKCISDILFHEKVMSLKNFIHHGEINRLQHSLCVSYFSYLICMRLNLDYRSAARGGLLHDFFLYDYHIDKPGNGIHGIIHPKIALTNACRYFELNKLEKDIIKKHMWPVTVYFPRYKESFIVSTVDKYCAILENWGLYRPQEIYSLIGD